MSLTIRGIRLIKWNTPQAAEKRRDRTPVWISPVRRVDRVAARERICAMTFSGGPWPLPARPDRFRGKPLTLVLAETLERYGAKGTFCVVGDVPVGLTDREAGARRMVPTGVKNCPELTRRLLAGGHELASHGYSHLSFGGVPRPLGGEKSLAGVEQVTADLKQLHAAVEKNWDYAMRLARPPRHVDRIWGGFSSFDVYAGMGYQYVSASFDSGSRRALESYQAEVEAIWRPVEKILLEDPDCFRGQIIAHTGGFNTAGRSPVADGLGRQLQLLTDHGYRVVTVSELLERSPFRDVPADSAVGRAARRLLKLGWCVAYQDNTLRPDAVLTRGELAMMAFGWETVRARVELIRRGRAPFRDMAPRHPYAAAAAMAAATRTMSAENGRFRPEDPVTAEELDRLCALRLGRRVPAGSWRQVKHGEFFLLMGEALDRGRK